MKLKDLKIEKHLLLAFVLVFLLMLVLGGAVWRQTNILWQQTQNLYYHPLQVRQAINGLEADIITMDRDMKKYILENTTSKRQKILQSINQNQADVALRFKTLYAQYLGPKTDIQEVQQVFNNWNIVMDEIVDLIRAGKNKKALEITSVNGGEGINTSKVLIKIHSIGLFANKKANEFYRNAAQQKKNLSKQLYFLFGISLVFLILINFLLNRIIRTPIKELTFAANKFTDGDFDARSSYRSKNELGKLSFAFNQLADTIQKQIITDQQAFKFNATLFNREDFGAFTRKLIKELAVLTQSQTSAFYLLNQEKTTFILQEALGFSAGAKTRFSAHLKEGEFGEALATRKISHLRDIPEDTAFVFTTANGNFKPREIIAIPILSEGHTVAMISLASLYPYPRETVLLLNRIFSSITARINGVLLFQKIKEQSSRLEQQNSELEMQSKELTTQSIELSRQNTELQVQKNQLDEANRLKSTFLSNMSHELRTPLNSVIALSSVLKRKLNTHIPEEEYSYIEVIERNGKLLLKLINDVLDLSRIEAGRVEIEQSSININDIINEMVSLIKPQAEEKKIELKSLVTKKLPVLKSDGNKIRHILQNLIGNAVKFTDKGKVEVTAVEKDNYLHIVVSDTGIGIQPNQIPYIFDEFRQVDSSTSRKFGGTGLGLSIAKKYARMLGGNIEVQSVPGKGSVFTLIIPLEFAEDNMGNTAEIIPPVAYPFQEADVKTRVEENEKLGEKTILVVEDNEPATIQLKDILDEAGFKVMVANNGREALEQIAKVIPDAMILDLMMPEVDGFQVLEAVRANVDTEHLPVLILTAKHIENDELKFLKKNHIYQLIQKGDINRQKLLRIAFQMVFPKEANNSEQANITDNVSKQTNIKNNQLPLILVVEDNEDNRLTIRSLLDDKYRIIEAENGQEGVAKAKAYHPDLILMDIAMPVMNGFRAFDAIRKEKPLQHTPVVAVTASAMTTNRDEILNYGFDGYISKPIDTNRFEKIIKSFLTVKRKNDENISH